MYWHILAARLAFVVVFENVVAIVMILVRWCIPDMPADLRDRIRREAYITNEIIIKQETIRAQLGKYLPYLLSTITSNFSFFKYLIFLFYNVPINSHI